MSAIWGTANMDGYVNLTENDLEMLADYEVTPSPATPFLTES